MKRATLLTIVMALLLALTASVALAKTISGTQNADLLHGTQNTDLMQGRGGNDEIYGKLGNDTINGGDASDKIYDQGGDDYMNGGDGADLVTMGDGRDEAYGAGGNDTIRAIRDDQPDFINCGRGGSDSASVQAGDYVDGTRATQLVGTSVTSCEKVIVNGILVIG